MNQMVSPRVFKAKPKLSEVHFGAPAPDGAPPRPKVRAEGLTFRYGGETALKNVSVSLFANRVTAFMGPSGCGKSTLLRTFNRMHDRYPDQSLEGEIWLDGENILAPDTNLNLLRRRVGMVFQQPSPFPMSIYGNVAWGIRLYETLTRPQMTARVEEALRRAALWDEVKDILRQSGLALSGGQQQRLCIARAIAVKPQVILMDEPCSALDPGSAARIEETINELKVDYTLALVTHNLQQAARVADYCGFMFLGELIEFGPTREVFLNPRDERTKNFVTGRFN